MSEAAQKPKSRAQLEAKIVELEATLAQARGDLGQARLARAEIDKREAETRAQFADLKERLVTAEANNQRMRGYIERAQEDDIAREELVTTGDPAGEQQLVPKRKHVLFCQPTPYSVIDGRLDSERVYDARYGQAGSRQQPKHWVRY